MIYRTRKNWEKGPLLPGGYWVIPSHRKEEVAMRLHDCRTGQRVAYVPNHAPKNDLSHQDVERGVISSWTDELVFVVFKNGSAPACEYENLVPLDEPDWVIRYTNAVVAYDGFGTLEMPPTNLEVVEGMGQGPLRRVAINPEAQDWQETRYLSGGVMCLRPAEMAQFEELGIIKKEIRG